MDGVEEPQSRIFCFGSNLAGRHGKGAAKDALMHHGAIYGRGVGMQGKSYAIPTKDEQLKVLPVNTIKIYVDKFMLFARQHPEFEFDVTRIGCGLAGYKPTEIGPLFRGAPKNCHLPFEFVAAIKSMPVESSNASIPVAPPRAQRFFFPVRSR